MTTGMLHRLTIRNVRLNMVLWKIFTLSCIYGISEATLMQSHPQSPEAFLKDRLLSAKVEMAKRYINNKRDSSKLLNVSATEPKVFEVGFNGGSSFAAFSQVLILADNSIHTINKSEGSLMLYPAAQLPNLASTDKLAFIKAVEENNILFILVALKSGYCKIYTATPSMNITQRQTIYIYGPQDAEFFSHKNELFLIIISSKPESYNVPSYIYRWTGTHFDEVKTFLTRGAVAVSTFLFKGSVIITVAQYPKDKPTIGSQVFRWSNYELERMQFLATNGPVAVQHLEAHGESYLIIINDFEYSSVFWWTGREFVNWDSFNDAKGMNKISIGYTEEDEPIILIAKNDKIKVYKLLENKLQRMTTVSLFEGEEIISMSLHMNDDSRLVVISRKNGVLSTSIFHLQLFKGHIGDYIQKTDQLLQCLKNVIDLLEIREEQIKVLEDESSSLLKLSEDATLKGKLIVNGTVNIRNTVVGKIETYSNGIHLKRNIVDIDEKISHLTEAINYNKNEAENLVQKSSPQKIVGTLHVEKDLIITNGSWDNIVLNEINGKPFNYPDMLSYGTDQVISGAVELSYLTTAVLNVTSLHGVTLEDLLLKGGNQIVSGSHEIKELITKQLYIPQEYGINQIELSKLITKDVQVVSGHKRIQNLNTHDLTARIMNGENVTNLEEKYVLKSGGEYEIKALTFLSDLMIENLIVTEINGLNWDEFIAEVFFVGENQNINGNLIFAGNVNIKDLYTPELNKSLVDDLMTLSTDQEIFSVIEVNKLKAVDITGMSFNGIDLNNDVALVGNVNNIKGAVNMVSARVHNLTTTDRAEWFAKWAGKSRKPAISYKNKVVILGDIQVEGISFMNSSIKINDTEFEMASIKDKYWNRHHPNVIIKDKLQIGNLNFVGNMQLQNINRFNAERLIHITESEVLNDITFEGLRIENGLHLTEFARISGINLYEMNRTAVLNKGNYVVKGRKNFIGGLYTDNLQATEINQINVSNMIPLKGEKHLLGNKSFDNIIIKEDLYAEDVADIDTLNSINITSKLPLALMKDQSFSIDAMTLSTVTAKSIETLTINEIHFDDLVKTLNQETSTIRIKEVKINGDFEFLGDLDIGKVNEIELYPYLQEVVDKRIGGEITGRKTFLEEVVIGNLKANEINGVDMVYLKENALSKTKPQNITGYSTIKRIQSANFVAQEINGKNIDSAIFIQDENHYSIESNIKFSDITVKGNLKVAQINGCDPSRVYSALYSPIKDRHMKELNISKNLSWKFPNGLEYSLSNYFDKAVLQKGNTVIQGKVTFLDKVYSEYVSTNGVINGINLTYIAEDCMMRSSTEQDLYGHKIFINSINASRVEVYGNANIKLINEIDIIETNRTLVRKSTEQEIYGYKHFQNEFKAEKLRCGGRVNGIFLSNIATINDDILPPTEVNNLVVTEHLEVGLINKINLNRFLQERVSLNDSQEISSKLQFSDMVTLLGDTKTMHINYIHLEDIMRTNSLTPQRMVGKKIFEQDVLVNGKMHVNLVNDKYLDEAYRLGIQADENTEIHGNVVFTSTVKVDSDINGSFSGHEMSYKYKIMEETYRNITEDLSFYNNKIDNDIMDCMELTKVIPREFAYLEYEDFKIQGMNVISAKHHVSEENAAISLYGLNKETCYLPKGCHCPSQYEMQIEDDGLTLISREDNERLFTFYDSERKLRVEIVTNTTSYGNRCRYLLGDYEEFSVMTVMSWNNKTSSLTYNLDFDKYSFEGYVSDVKSLSVGNKLYIAIAIYYDAILSSHNVDSYVIEWTDGESLPTLFQYIPTYGAKVLELFQSQEGVYLFIGNSYDSYKRSYLVDSEIYRLNPKSNEFMLLRSLKTKGVNSAESLIIQNEKFIIVSQQFSMPLIILKYNEDYDNFYLYQKLFIEDTSVGVGSFYLEGNGIEDAFLGVAVTDGSFHLYKYSHIEGFKKIMSSWQRGITGFVPISSGKRHFILTPSELETTMMHVVFQGGDYY